jgi:hypothetical protein
MPHAACTPRPQKEVAKDHPEWLDSMLKLQVQSQKPGDFVQISTTPPQVTVINNKVCSNTRNNRTEITCAMSHEVSSCAGQRAAGPAPIPRAVWGCGGLMTGRARLSRPS